MSKMDFKSSPGIKAQSAKAPSFKQNQSDPNAQATLWLAKQIYDQNLKKQEESNIGGNIERIRAQFGGQIPVNTKLKAGNATLDLNPKLDTEQTKAVAASQLYPNIKNQAVDLIKKGTLNSKNGALGLGIFPEVDRTIRQFSVERSNPLTTYYDKDLQRLQSKMQKLKELMFDRGGTALTPTETKILGAPFILHGKSDEQILEDIGTADSLLETKARLALGGSNAAMSPIPGMNQPQPEPESGINIEQERQEAIQRIQNGKYNADKVASIFKQRTGQDL